MPPASLTVVVCMFWCTMTLFAYSDKNETTFVASREWRPVKKGQPIPGGLHVRHNFQTGLTEAKILDEVKADSDDDNDDRRTNSLMLYPDESAVSSSNEDAKADDNRREADISGISVDELKARLKKIKLVNRDSKSESETQERFKSHSININDSKASELNVTTDAEMLKTYFRRFERYKNLVGGEPLTGSIVDDVLHVLNDMTSLMHQLDIARTFTDMGGMAKVVSPCLNATNDRIKAEALRLLGTAVQSNPTVQSKALEHDFVQKLLHILVVSNKLNVQSRCMFALSALVRQYPMAQKALIDHGGLKIFGQILEDGHVKVQSRVMSLTNDLAVERIGLQKVEDEVFRRQKTQEYTNTRFEKKLQSHNYCKHLSNFMIRSFSNEPFDRSNIADYAFLAVILDSMITLGSTCKIDFHAQRYSLMAVIKDALRHYESLGDDGSSSDDDHSYGHLASQLTTLMKTIFERVNDEF